MIQRARTAVSTLLLATVCVMLMAAAAVAQQPADMVLHNGKILTVDDSFSTAQAVAISGNKIAAVGSDADVMNLAGAGTKVIDLKGRTVIPGLIDTHRHIYETEHYDGKLTPDQQKNYPVDWR